jgi:hypothetical protein
VTGSNAGERKEGGTYRASVLARAVLGGLLVSIDGGGARNVLGGRSGLGGGESVLGLLSLCRAGLALALARSALDQVKK